MANPNVTEKAILKTVTSFKDLSHKDRINFIKNLNKKGLAAKPPKQVYVEGCNISNLPEKLQAVIKRVKEDEAYKEAILKELHRAVQILVKHAHEHQTFCDTFVYPSDLGKRLTKIFGLTESELKTEMSKIGFYQGQRNYSEPYYLTLCIVATMGMYIDNDTMITIPILLVAARFWNALVKRSWKLGCNPDIARYVQNYMIKSNSDYVKLGTPYAFLFNHFVPQKRQFIPRYVRQDAADPKTGMIKLLTVIQPGLRTIVVTTLAKHYYEAYEKGLKETAEDAYAKAYQDNQEMVEKRETIKNIIDQIGDTFDKNALMDKTGINDPAISNILKNKFRISDKVIESINEWILNNEEDLKIIVDLLLEGIQPTSVEEFCGINIDVLIKNIGNAKKNEAYIKIKQYREQITKEIFGQSAYEKLGAQSWYRLLSIVNYALILYVKKLTCKK